MKLLIVDDQISSQFKLVEYLQADLKLQDNDIKIASNGFEAITIAEQQKIDIVLMDLQMPIMDGLTTTKKLVKKYPHTKIIIVTSFDDKASTQKAINLGAKGYLSKNNLSENLISTIQNVANGYMVFPEIDKNINNINLDSNNIIQTNREDKKNKLDKIIASQTINKWLVSEKQVNSEKHNYLDYLEINPEDKHSVLKFILRGNSCKCSLVEELHLRYDMLVSKSINNIKIDKNDLENILDRIIEQLNYWIYNEQEDSNFYCFKSRLEANSQILRVEYAKSFNKYLDFILSDISPVPCLQKLESIETLINTCVNDYEQELENYIEQEKSLFKAYYVLMDILYESPISILDREAIDSLLRAIQHIYYAKIHIEALNLALEVIQGIARVIKFGIDDLILAISLLKAINYRLDTLDLDRDTSLLIKSEFDTFQNTSNLLGEIEKEVGYSINRWGVRGCINSKLIEDKLLSKISNSSELILNKIEHKLSI